jgi:hypothetical protein
MALEKYQDAVPMCGRKNNKKIQNNLVNILHLNFDQLQLKDIITGIS